MSKNFNYDSNNATLNALLYIVAGILFCLFKADVLNWAMTIIGAFIVLVGVFKAVKWSSVEGVINIILGLVVIFGGWLFVDIVLLIIGAWLAIQGVLGFMSAREFRYKPAMFSSIITTLVGLMLIVSKWALLDWLFIIIGIVLIVDGVMMLFEKRA